MRGLASRLSTPTARFRWRIVAASWFYLAGVIGLISTMFIASVMCFVNMKYGWIVPDPMNPLSVDAMAFTSHSILKLQVLASHSFLSLFAANSWQRGWWCCAGIASLGWFAIGGVAQVTGLGFVR